MQYNTETEESATRAGFEPITEPYRKSELPLFEKAVEQLGDKTFKIVSLGGGVLQIWRPSNQIFTSTHNA